jgi:hypothetical protein
MFSIFYFLDIYVQTWPNELHNSFWRQESVEDRVRSS